MKLRVAYADDELLARKRLARLLDAMPDVEVVAAAAGAAELAALLAATPADVLLLDVQMPDLDGLEAAPLLRARARHVIYVTAHRDHALAAFEVGATDYLLKPVEAARLRQALDRVRAAQPAAPARLAIATRDGVQLLDVETITHLSFDGALVTIHRAGGAPIVSERSISELEARLPPGRFERVHRRHLLALHHLVRLVPTDTGGFIAVVAGGAEVPVSRQCARDLRRRLGLHG
jgi:two-component system LytT family response regulator